MHMGAGASDSWRKNTDGPCKWLKGQGQDEKPHSMYEELWQGNEGSSIAEQLGAQADLWIWKIWGRIPVPALTSCVTLGHFLHLSEFQFPHLPNGANTTSL